MDGVAAGLIAALIGGVSGYVSALLTNVIERRKVIDESVRAIRSVRYAELWRFMSLLPKWPRAENVTYRDLDILSRSLRNWYFGVADEPGDRRLERKEGTTPPETESPKADPGGMYLSTSARHEYGKFQECIMSTVDGAAKGHRDSRLTGDDYSEVQRRASSLRTAMTADLLSRRRAFMVR
jgi:hypothetical protein